jgi:hypothetical protein
MPDRRFIFIRDDVLLVHEFIQSLGMSMFTSDTQKKPVMEPIDRDELKVFYGSLLIMRPEWIVHEPVFNQVSAGYYAGLYSVKPDVNMFAIHLTVFGETGEKSIDGVRKLGSGSIGFRPSWLDDKNRSLPDTPPEVGDYYKAIMKHFLSNNFVKTNRGRPQRYYLTRLALQVIGTEPTLPPFDFITWPPDLKPTEKS